MLASKGLVYRIGHKVMAPHTRIADITPARKHHWLDWFFTKSLYAAVIILGIVLTVVTPIIPRAEWIFVTTWYAMLIPFTFIAYWFLQLLHELGHYVLLRRYKTETSISIVHRWHLILPHTDLSGAKLLPLKGRLMVYLGGIFMDLFIIGVAAFFMTLGVGVWFWQYIYLLTFINLAFQFVTLQRSDITQAAEQLLDVDSVHEAVKRSLTTSCKRYEMENRFIFPMFLVGVIILALLLIAYIIPIAIMIVDQAAESLVWTKSLDIYVDSLVSLLLISIFLSFFFVGMIREHKLSSRDWFAWLNTFLFTLSNYATVFLVMITFMRYSNPFLTTVASFLLGIIFGLLFLRIIEHIDVEETGFTRDFFLPIMVALTALLLMAMSSWYSAVTGTVHVTSLYALAYSAGMIGSMVL